MNAGVLAMRRRTFYFMLALQIISVVALLIVAGVVWDTRGDQNHTLSGLVIGCERANRTRNALHWIASHTPGIPPAVLEGLELAPREHPQEARPWLVECADAYR